MTKAFDAILDRHNKLEEEKTKFGGDTYIKRHQLPQITVSFKDWNEFKDDIEIIKRIGKQFGGDFSHLSAELYILYEMDLEENAKNPYNLMIQHMAADTLGKISCALLQTGPLEDKIGHFFGDNTKDYDLLLNGDDYCFIALMLNELLFSYVSLINFLYIKRYLNEDFLNAIRDRLNFIISEQFESLRIRFKAAHVFSIVNQKGERLETIH